ncbi:P-loop containing nucleoside triphosphate hydrolase protein [Serendipita vermifera]|nr:P-loop containing nucleoside triphosphate hydrolase protein [Serendipita vermifera]
MAQKDNLQEMNDAFVEILFKEISGDQKDPVPDLKDPSKDKDALYTDWKKENSQPAIDPGLAFTNILRKKYHGWSIVRINNPYMFQLFGYPEMLTRPLPDETIDSVVAAFIPFTRRSGRVGGVIAEVVKCGGFMSAWKSFDFIVYQVIFPSGLYFEQNFWILHKGNEEPIYALLSTVGSWLQELHEEVLVYDQGFWQKDANLYQEIQRADWKDVILKEKFKKSIRADINDFFNNEAVYKELAVPWKRGLIFYGPAGNGKTISLKAAMHETNNPILYVRTLTNWRGDEAAMADIFEMARRFSPCMLILEDIDSHINERNRSFFLNQLDGLDNNDGILLIATTNHLERLDNSVANRPSRFDRKYLFDDPDEEERRLYCKYWQNKLRNNSKIPFPDSLVDEVAEQSDGLSFAYIKEAFVSTLVLMAGDAELDFAKTLKAQVKELKDQVRDHPPSVAVKNTSPPPADIGGPSEMTSTRELLQKLMGGDVPRGMSSKSIFPSANIGLRRWM